MAQSSDFTLRFQIRSFKALDSRALLACQDYNLGNHSDWFGHFRRGLYGCYARLFGVCHLYRALHCVQTVPTLPTFAEYAVSGVLFNMDSGIECLVYALNAFGFAVQRSDFRDPADPTTVQHVGPADVIGTQRSPQPKKGGYASLWPKVQTYWMGQRDLISTIFLEHNLSKHRGTTFQGGSTRRVDASELTKLGIDPSSPEAFLFEPMTETIMSTRHPDPRLQTAQGYTTLEAIAGEFETFMNHTGDLALADAVSRVQLKHEDFKHP